MIFIYNLDEQLNSGVLVCPQTKQKLMWDKEESCIKTSDGKYKYTVIDSRIPIMLID